MWVKILEYGTQPYTPNAGAVGTLTSASNLHPTSFAKLSDADINSLGGSEYYLRVMSSNDNHYLYMKITNLAFTDTSRAFGYSSQQYSQEVASSFAAASAHWKTGTHCGPRLDTECDATGNNGERWFADYSANIHCYSTSTSGSRCFTDGSTDGHKMREHVTMWIAKAA